MCNWGHSDNIWPAPEVYSKCATGAILITFGLHPRFTQRLEACELEGFHRASSLWKDLEDAKE